ncbi:putative thiol methyltransferase 2 [Cladobotryum mycophilum]|uniref:Thiol methyltransferase 2 n=1 Tax=Cladobotryum mycophilum TaxID=491253 RepID=A0ABR0SP86_9HYPO
MENKKTDLKSEGAARLVAHFNTRAREHQGQGWSDLWESNESDLWDRGKPSPALIGFIESKPDVFRVPEEGEKLRALVPGCGKGYDVAMLALHGFDVWGLELSETGAQVAWKYAVSQLAEPGEVNFGRAGEWPLVEPGNVEIVAGDFFKKEWEGKCVDEDGVRVGGFDLIYDYTFLCALLPEMRQDWARRMSQLLNPNGVLICLEFPLFRDLNELGPPWGLRGVYWDLLAKGELVC